MSESTIATAEPSPGGIKRIEDAVIRIAGNSQDGIQAIGAFLARLAGRSAQEVMTYMTIPATISGGPSIFQVRIGSGEVLSAGDEADFLVAFYQHSYENHIGFLRDGGILLYDSDHVKPNLEDKRYRYVGVPISGATVESVGGTSKDKGKNIFTLGLLARIFNLNTEKLENLIKERFGGKGDDVVKNALLAFHAGNGYSVGNILETFQFIPSKQDLTRVQVTMDGNQAIAYGLIAAGVRFGAGYPITPWSSIMEMLRSELPKYGGTFVQTEDEIAAIAMACGGSYAGRVAVTGSSGPGISLKTEAIGWAVMAEIPVVIIDVQRGGPSTGLPTNVEQSDLNIAVFGGHGDSPRVVMAPSSVEDCFYSVIEAVNIARNYSVPVIFLTDQSMATRIEAFPMPDLHKLMQDISPNFTPVENGELPYAENPEGVARHHAPGTRFPSGKYPTVTGLEHDAAGHPTGSPKIHQAMVAKRRRKLQKLGESLPAPDIYGAAQGDVLLVGWGSTQGPIREAVDRLRRENLAIGAIHIKHIHPLPSGLEKIFAAYRHVLVVEMNDEGLYGFGQLGALLRARHCDPKIRGITKTDGLPFKVREITEGVRARLENRAIVLNTQDVGAAESGG
ncbi:MAG: 2-oxoacid:acceptor oxidoreductase subunit alpha [Verrucomicrobiae bacterium]|nr:2-oxoacid:acceptor oxidoreductase subunit alpha [Verrucomicrobiae bacterium]